jgi:hypothetical protein
LNIWSWNILEGISTKLEGIWRESIHPNIAELNLKVEKCSELPSSTVFKHSINYQTDQGVKIKTNQNDFKR